MYYFKVMPQFNECGATYQRLANMMFRDQISKIVEFYANDMLVKSKNADNHIKHLGNMFVVLRNYQMKLSPLKCVFGVSLGNFLGFMVNQQGIEANPKKIQVLLNMKSPIKSKEVQSLIRKVTTE